MNLISKNLLNEIKKILLNSNNLQTKQERHKFIQNNLVNIFREKGFFTIPEYQISYRYKFRSKKNL